MLEYNKVRVIDLIIDKMDIESLEFKILNNEITGRPAFNPKHLTKKLDYYIELENRMDESRQDEINLI